MRRTTFLGAGAAAFLTGCGGGHRSLGALPGVATFTSSRPPTGNVRLVPDTADPIPPAVLASPIIGEAARFDGAAAPAGWMLCQGQTLTVAANRQLFAVLGSIAGGDGKTTFKLPNGRSLIIAASGAFPGSTAVFTQAGRHISPSSSLGPGARPAMPRMPKPLSAEALAERRLTTQSVRVRASSPTPIAAELAGRLRQANDDARSAAVRALSAGNQARLSAAVDAAVNGQMRVYDAVVQMAGSLTDAETSALLATSDATTRALGGASSPEARANARLAAGYFLLSVAFTPDQLQAMGERERIAGQ